jgi:lycopene beta-cyclase
MTYLQFHLVFIVPPLVALATVVRLRPPEVSSRVRWALPLLAVLALAWTTPWDNYLVWRGVWGYGDGRVLGTIGYVPIEEYLFFVLQPLLTGLWFVWLLGRERRRTEEQAPSARGGMRPLALAWALLAVAGGLMLMRDPTTYLGLILVWACPILAGQVLYAGSTLRRLRATVLPGIAVPTLYLWVADAIAIRIGIWHIAPRYTTGAHIAGLPIEEATFFLVTNILVVQGLVMFLFPRAASGPSGTARTGEA